MGENSFEEYKQLAQEQARSLLDVVQSVAQGDLDVKVEAPEGIPVLSELALGIGAMVDSLREMLAEHERVRTEFETALAQGDVLYRVSQALNTATSYDQIVKALQQHPVVQQASQGSLVLFDRPWDTDPAGGPADGGAPDWIEVVASWRASGRQAVTPVGTRYELQTFPVARHLKPDEPFVVEDIADDPRLGEDMRQLYLGLFQAHSTIFIPMVAGERWIGWLNTLMDEPTQFPDDQVRHLMTLVGQAAVALRNLHQLEDIQAHARREQALREITARVRGFTDPDAIARAAVRELGAALGRSAFVRLGSAEELASDDKR
ncbi:MAG: GAF domain-containing protein [Chloroflexi bacterium]|nr:GAF domain-containing protein [Chloroflexota bacterium]